MYATTFGEAHTQSFADIITDRLLRGAVGLGEKVAQPETLDGATAHVIHATGWMYENRQSIIIAGMWGIALAALLISVAATYADNQAQLQAQTVCMPSPFPEIAGPICQRLDPSQMHLLQTPPPTALPNTP